MAKLILIWLGQVFRLVPTIGDNDRERSADGLGWFSTSLDPAWRRAVLAFRDGTERFWGHALTNVGVEWNRLDAQRGWKLLVGWAQLAFYAGVALGAVIASVGFLWLA